jgi:S1-C subfamily serine protease
MNKKLVLLVFSVFMMVILACQLSVPADWLTQPTPLVSNQLPLDQPPDSPQQPSIPTENLTADQELLANLYDQVSPGVVAIQVLSEQGGALGSGFVFDKQGNILTNYHVVEGATDVEVDFPSGMKLRGKVGGVDMDSDLAVVQVDAPADRLFPLVMGDSDALRVGQMVVAIGNPFGLSGTMTLGIVSAKGRNLESIRTTAEGRSFSAGDVIQTDASINPGNSGGPLLNLKGEVVGVNRAIQTTSTNSSGDPVNIGIGFAISSSIVKRVVPVLISTGKYDYPYLGISAIDEVSLIFQEALGLSQSSGAYLVEVTPGGPADQAGLRAGTQSTVITGLNAGGDLIIATDGTPVRIYADLIAYLMTRKSPGDQVILTIIRDGKQKEVTVTLDKRP